MGEQPIPVLLPLFQWPGKFNQFGLVASTTTCDLAEQLYRFIRADSNLRTIQLFPVLLIDAYDPEDIRSRLIEYARDHKLDGKNTSFNITGGTKLMSLAAQQAASELGMTTMYIATEKQLVITFPNNGENPQLWPLKVNLTIQQYLMAHGIESSNSPNFGAGPVNAIPPREGDQLEQDVLLLLSRSGCFDEVQRDVYIAKNLRQPGEVRNELDIVVIRNGKLAVISCKSGKVTREKLYELISVSSREKAGVYCEKVMVASTQQPKGITDRAAIERITIITRRNLSTLPEVLMKKLG